jgi:hypothetical protein
MKRTFKARGIHGLSGVVRFDSAAHWPPEDDEPIGWSCGAVEFNRAKKVAPTISFLADCDCGCCSDHDGGIEFVADKKMAANLRSIADLIDATPIDRAQHQITLRPQ